MRRPGIEVLKRELGCTSSGTWVIVLDVLNVLDL